MALGPEKNKNSKGSLPILKYAGYGIGLAVFIAFVYFFYMTRSDQITSDQATRDDSSQADQQMNDMWDRESDTRTLRLPPGALDNPEISPEERERLLQNLVPL